ncbi:hypothetical protein [Streptomyces luteogriseus]|uniref:hypothetical protein n=1 Tax=Streptomyces luteogriseus TaxID=68233 RepID=UPI0037B37EA3
MGLNYELAKIKDFEKTCFVGEGNDAPMSPVTESLIFSTITAGTPEITEKNYEEFYIRLTMLEVLYGPPMRSQSGDVSFTLEDVRRHIGLRTNATPFSKAKFNNEVGRILRERATSKLFEQREAPQTATV